MKNNRQRIRIIPDRIFFKLYNEAGKYEQGDEYISAALIKEDIKFNYEKYGLEYDRAVYMLDKIFIMRKMEFSNILSAVKKTKSQISNMYCIPIRTIEDWTAKKNRTPDYIKLIILKDFGLFDLGKYIHLESDIEKNRKAECGRKENDCSNNTKEKARNNKTQSVYRGCDQQTTENIYSSLYVRELLERTSYIKR